MAADTGRRGTHRRLDRVTDPETRRRAKRHAVALVTTGHELHRATVNGNARLAAEQVALLTQLMAEAGADVGFELLVGAVTGVASSLLALGERRGLDPDETLRLVGVRLAAGGLPT